MKDKWVGVTDCVNGTHLQVSPEIIYRKMGSG